MEFIESITQHFEKTLDSILKEINIIALKEGKNLCSKRRYYLAVEEKKAIQTNSYLDKLVKAKKVNSILKSFMDLINSVIKINNGYIIKSSCYNFSTDDFYDSLTMAADDSFSLNHEDLKKEYLFDLKETDQIKLLSKKYIRQNIFIFELQLINLLNNYKCLLSCIKRLEKKLTFNVMNDVLISKKRERNEEGASEKEFEKDIINYKKSKLINPGNFQEDLLKSSLRNFFFNPNNEEELERISSNSSINSNFNTRESSYRTENSEDHFYDEEEGESPEKISKIENIPSKTILYENNQTIFLELEKKILNQEQINK
jgi:hypothetical protein